MPNFDLHFSIIDLEWRLHSCELDVAMQGCHVLPVIWSAIYLLLFGSVEVFRSCGFAGSPLDGSNMFKHVQTVQTVRSIFLFWWLQINPDGSIFDSGCLIFLLCLPYQNQNFWLTDLDFELQNITNKNASNMSYVIWGRNFFIGCWTWAQSHRFQLPRARWWPCCRTFVSCSATWQNGAGIEVSTKDEYRIKSNS